MGQPVTDSFEPNESKKDCLYSFAADYSLNSQVCCGLPMFDNSFSSKNIENIPRKSWGFLTIILTRC
jgi:hypothetical protein